MEGGRSLSTNCLRHLFAETTLPYDTARFQVLLLRQATCRLSFGILQHQPQCCWPQGLCGLFVLLQRGCESLLRRINSASRPHTVPRPPRPAVRMARNEEKAQSMLNRFLAGKQEEKRGPKQRRPYLASEVTDLNEADKWRQQILREVGKKVMEIQNAGLGEHRCAQTGSTRWWRHCGGSAAMDRLCTATCTPITLSFTACCRLLPPLQQLSQASLGYPLSSSRPCSNNRCIGPQVTLSAP